MQLALIILLGIFGVFLGAIIETNWEIHKEFEARNNTESEDVPKFFNAEDNEIFERSTSSIESLRAKAEWGTKLLIDAPELVGTTISYNNHIANEKVILLTYKNSSEEYINGQIKLDLLGSYGAIVALSRILNESIKTDICLITYDGTAMKIDMDELKNVLKMIDEYMEIIKEIDRV